MAEFFAVLNAISSLSSSFGLVADAIWTIRDLLPDRFAQLYNSFKDQESAVRVTCLRLRGWERLWSQGTAAKTFDGEDGEEQTGRKLDGTTVPELRKLQEQVNEINKMLKNHIAHPGEGLGFTWKAFASLEEPLPRMSELSSTSFCQSIATFEIQRLVDHVGNLIQIVEQLRLAVSIRYSERATTREEETAREELTNLQSLANDLLAAYEGISGGNHQGGLIMRPPDDLDVQLSIIKGNYQIKYHTLRGEQHGITTSCVACQFGSKPLLGRVPKLPRKQKPRGTLYLNQTMRSRFKLLIKLPAKEREQELRRTYLVRVAAALYITVMAVILLSTDLMKELTTECITEVVQDLGDSVPAFVGRNQELQPLPQAAQDRRFFMLAVLLAELALAQPIHIESNEHDLSIMLQAGNGSFETVNQQQLLLRVKNATSLTYQRAVVHCFFEDDELTRVNLPRGSQRQQVLNTTQSIARFHRSVFLPLAEHYRIVRSHEIEMVEIEDRAKSSRTVPKALRLPALAQASRTPSSRSMQWSRAPTLVTRNHSRIEQR